MNYCKIHVVIKNSIEEIRIFNIKILNLSYLAGYLLLRNISVQVRLTKTISSLSRTQTNKYYPKHLLYMEPNKMKPNNRFHPWDDISAQW